MELCIVLRAEGIDKHAFRAIQDAPKNFLFVHSILVRLCERVKGLSGIANEPTNMHGAFKSIKDSELAQRLSMFAVVVFPVRLVVGVISWESNSRRASGCSGSMAVVLPLGSYSLFCCYGNSSTYGSS
jgi:hypothetical protein